MNTSDLLAEVGRLYGCIAGKIESPGAFVEWLESKGDDDIIGEAGHMWSCPIHNFLKESCDPDGKKDTQSNAAIEVGSMSTTLRKGAAIMPRLVIHPSWVRAFITFLDAEFQDRKRVRVKAKDAKAILHSVMEKMKVDAGGTAA